MNVKISLTCLLHFLSYSYRVETNLLEQQQAPAIIWSKPAGYKYCFEKTYAVKKNLEEQAAKSKDQA